MSRSLAQSLREREARHQKWLEVTHIITKDRPPLKGRILEVRDLHIKADFSEEPKYRRTDKIKVMLKSRCSPCK